MKVSHVVPHFFPMITGVGTHVWNICRGLPNTEFDILAPALRGEPARETLFSNTHVIRTQPRTPWAEYYPPPYHPRFSPVANEFLHLLRFERLKQTLANAEIVHNHATPFEVLYRVGARRGLSAFKRLADRALAFSARKVVATDHSLFSHLTTEEGLIGRYRDCGLSLLANHDVVICVEPSGLPVAKELARSQGADPRIIYIPNSIDSKLFRPFDIDRASPKFRLGFCGRASKPGYEFLAMVASRLADEAEIWACVAGSRRSLYKWDLLRSQPNISLFTNLQTQAMPFFYNSVDCLLNPIVAPGMSLASLEAMSCGVPVIMLKGDRYPIEDGRTGLLVDAEPTALIEAVWRLRDDQRLYRRLAHTSREKILEEFSSERVLPRLAQEYSR